MASPNDDFVDLPWYYEVEVAGKKPTTVSPISGERHKARIALVRSLLEELFDGTLTQKRVLDLGCNAGVFGLECLSAGVSSYTGVDSSQRAIAQAMYLFQDRNIAKERYQFVTSDIFEFLHNAFREQWDVVLALGIVHHLPWYRFFEFFDGVNALCTDILILDLVLASTSVAPAFQLYTRQTPHSQNPDGKVVIHPTKSALATLMGRLGFDVAVIKPCFPRTGAFADYHRGNRRFVVGCKKTRLDTIAALRDDVCDIRLDGVPFRALISACFRKIWKRMCAPISR